MAIWDRVLEAAEERMGVSVVRSQWVDQVKESLERFDQFREEASELAWHSLEYFSGRPQELRPEARRRLAQRSRIALMEDPLAGAEAELLTNFSFGKGVQMPTADDDDVQEVIEEAWDDPVNQTKLTGFEAQRLRSNDMITTANLFPVGFLRSGKVRIAFLIPERVVDVICDPDDDERPLWYVYDEPLRAEYDFISERWRLPGEDSTLQPTVGFTGRNLRYYPHWRNIEQAIQERRENNLPPLSMPPMDRIGRGVVEHFRINRIGRSQFGTPPWARTLRFYSAMNQVVESHVAMARAASSFIARRVMQGSPETVTRAANNVLAMTGELGAARFGEGQPPADMIREGRLPNPGSFWVENEQHRLESLQLSSGAAQAMQTTQIVRGQVAAPSGFGPHYLGDPSATNLATATSLELPTLMTVQAWQETFTQIFKWFTDLVIQTAVRAGRLGAEAALPELPVKLSELRLYEAMERAEAESRTGRRLTYKFSMPYPGRRNLPDVAAMVTTVKAAFDPMGQNVPLQRALLLFLAQHGMQVDDPGEWVEDVLPEAAIRAAAAAALTQQEQQGVQNAAQQAMQGAKLAAFQQGNFGGVNAANGQGDPSASPSNGELPKNAPVSALGEQVDELFAQAVIEPLLMGAGRN